MIVTPPNWVTEAGVMELIKGTSAGGAGILKLMGSLGALNPLALLEMTRANTFTPRLTGTNPEIVWALNAVKKDPIV